MEILDLIFRWLHVIPAMVMVGGVFFIRYCLLSPGSDSASATPTLFDQQDALRKRWMKAVMVATLLLLVSGIYNAAIKSMGFRLGATYNGLLGLKMLLAFVVFYLSAVLVGRSERAQRMRQRKANYTILLLLMMAVVMIAGYMKISSTHAEPRIKKTPAARVTLVSPTTSPATSSSLTSALSRSQP